MKSVEVSQLKEKLEKTQNLPAKKKRFVQTTFFKPVVKKQIVLDKEFEKLLDLIKEIDINSITPIEAMKKLSVIKEKLKELNS